nr:hypothetical protein [Tanacetum cinerariifolium]
MYNWIIAKYGTPNENLTNSQFESIADDVYTTFFEKADPPKDVVKPDVGYLAKTTNLEADQGIVFYVEVIVIDSSSLELECPSTSELECSSTSELEFLSYDELSSYLSSSDEFD